MPRIASRVLCDQLPETHGRRGLGRKALGARDDDRGSPSTFCAPGSQQMREMGATFSSKRFLNRLTCSTSLVRLRAPSRGAARISASTARTRASKRRQRSRASFPARFTSTRTSSRRVRNSANLFRTRSDTLTLPAVGRDVFAIVVLIVASEAISCESRTIPSDSPQDASTVARIISNRRCSVLRPRPPTHLTTIFSEDLRDLSKESLRIGPRSLEAVAPGLSAPYRPKISWTRSFMGHPRVALARLPSGSRP